MRSNDCSVEGFGDAWDAAHVYQSNYSLGGSTVAAVTGTGSAGLSVSVPTPEFRNMIEGDIAPVASITVGFKPLFGILNQPKFIYPPSMVTINYGVRTSI